MEYRSDGMIWLPQETFDKLPDNLKEDLHNEWKPHQDEEDVYEFSYWKWYTEYEDVASWEDFYYECQENNLKIDLIVIGEDNAIVFEPNYSKFEVRTQISFAKE